MYSKTKEVYYCQFCKKHGLSKSKMEYHEKICGYNPENVRACHSCMLLEKKEIEVFYDTGRGEESVIKDCLHCSKRNVFLYPPKVEVKKNWFEFGNESNEPMPKICEFQRTTESDFFFYSEP